MPSQTLLPTIVAHADWSTDRSKRWGAIARRSPPGFHVESLSTIGEVNTYFRRLVAMDADGPASVFAGFDFPIGVAKHYADLVGVQSFRDLLPELGAGQWADFYMPASDSTEISPRRPFYPQAPGGTSQAYLAQALAAPSAPKLSSLLRACEAKTPQRQAACCLFWTLGGNQVGKAAISGWKDLLAPALRDDAFDVRLWPFDGGLFPLFAAGRVVVAETYPGEIYHHLGLRLRGLGLEGAGKRSQAARKANATAILVWAADNDVSFHESIVAVIRDGFGSEASGEDSFDALVGLLGMLEVLLSGREPAVGPHPAVEGWILGQTVEAKFYRIEERTHNG
jgi:hypothetical protein